LVGRPVGKTSLRLVEGTNMIDCNAFVLSRTSGNHPTKTSLPKAIASNPRSREPTAAEMLQALKDVARQTQDSAISATIGGFEKLGCTRAQGKSGYMCDYLVDVNTQVRPMDNSAAGARHAQSMQLLMNALAQASNASKRNNTGRFLYVEGRSRWVKLEN
jgi:hypothetical protein